MIVQFDIGNAILSDPAGADYRIRMGVGDTWVILGGGYASPSEALNALKECLTYSAPPPPDLSIVDEAVGAVAGLSDRIADLEGGLQSLGDRVIAIEEAGSKAATPRAGILSRLRPGGGNQPPQIAHPGPPPIRRPRSVSIGMESGGGNTGRGKMPITGRAIRPGAPENEDFQGEDLE